MLSWGMRPPTWIDPCIGAAPGPVERQPVPLDPAARKRWDAADPPRGAVADGPRDPADRRRRARDRAQRPGGSGAGVRALARIEARGAGVAARRRTPAGDHR